MCFPLEPQKNPKSNNGNSGQTGPVPPSPRDGPSPPVPSIRNPEEPAHRDAGPFAKTRSRRFLFFLIPLFCCSFFAVILTGKGFGLSWDEAYYYQPSRDAAGWLSRVLFSGNRPLSTREIDIAWEEIRELPSLVKICLGTSSLLFEGILDPLIALRIPSAAAFSLTLILIFLLAYRSFGWFPALFAVLSYALMPRIWGHAHIAAAESITVLLYLAVVLCFIKGLDRPWASVALGVVFGLALVTKINCVFLPAILLPWAHIYHRKKYANNFFAMVFLSPVIMVLAWPWLWPDPAKRFLEYLYFFASHQMTAVFYMGEKFNYGDTAAPWHYPFLMTLVTLPPLVLLFSLAGAIESLAGIRRRPLHVLFLWAALLTLLIAAIPASPKYDGVRLFLPAFPFIAILAGGGLHALLKKLPKGPPLHRAVYWKDIIAVTGLVLLLLTAGFSLVRSHPHSLSYFNIFIGGIRGAYEKGMETTYWGEAVNNHVLEVLNELPEGSEIKTLALHDKVFDLLKDWGRLRDDLVLNRASPPFDYHLLLVRKGFFARPESCLYSSWPSLKVFEYREVPLVILYKTGAPFEKAWPAFGRKNENEAEKH